VVAHRPRKGAAINTAMAGAIEHLTRALAVDLAPVRVNAVCPGLVLTDVWNSIPEESRAEQIRRMTARQLLLRGRTRRRSRRPTSISCARPTPPARS
jgi:NAD(P)-dependent dehydrogenase (short-subunit alcohol dehydrogenase family)